MITQEEIGGVFNRFMSSIENEYRAMTEEQVRARWYFKFDSSRSLAWNIYQFNDMLDLYKGSCRRWEEMHNGHCCVVERVRDKYLMPKIKEFEQQIREYIGPCGETADTSDSKSDA